MITQNYIALTSKIKSFALDLGFDLVRIAKAEKSKSSAAYLKKWLSSHKNADMKWMENSPSRRANPAKILPKARTIICLAVNYRTTVPPRLHKDGIKIACYAWSRNYHKIIEKQLKRLARFIKQLAPDAALKSYVDTGPFLERHFAANAGLGIIGKNTCLITREFGSYVFLAEIITNLTLPPDQPPAAKISCGACERCIKSCPTGALAAPRRVPRNNSKALTMPYELDARKCISYLTIESRGKIPKILRKKISPWIFGCDICQEVCPHNVRAQPTKNPDFALAPQLKKLTLKKLRAIKTEKEFKKLLAGTSLIRAKFKGIKRNLKIV